MQRKNSSSSSFSKSACNCGKKVSRKNSSVRVAKQVEIASYAAQQYPQVFKHPTTSILAVAPERTFWEKVTILHKEAFRTNGRFAARYSRMEGSQTCHVPSAENKGLAIKERATLTAH